MDSYNVIVEHALFDGTLVSVQTNIDGDLAPAKRSFIHVHNLNKADDTSIMIICCILRM